MEQLNDRPVEKIAEVVRKPITWYPQLKAIAAGAQVQFEFPTAGDMGGFLVVIQANATNPNDVLFVGLGSGIGGAKLPLSPKQSCTLPHQPDEYVVTVYNPTANAHNVCVVGYQGFSPNYA